jgi:hypothetical protein
LHLLLLHLLLPLLLLPKQQELLLLSKQGPHVVARTAAAYLI